MEWIVPARNHITNFFLICKMTNGGKQWMSFYFFVILSFDGHQ